MAQTQLHELSDTLSLLCRTCAARSSCACGSCAHDVLKRIGKSARLVNYSAGSMLLTRSERSSTMITLQSGIAFSHLATDDGRKQAVWMHFTGDTLGSPLNLPAPHDVVALTEVKACIIDREAYQDAIDSDPGFRSHVVNKALWDFSAAQGWMLTIGRKTPSERVASLLHLLSTKGPAQTISATGRVEISLPLSRREIGDFLALSVETVSRGFTALRADGIITVSGKVVIVRDSKRLQAATGDATTRPVY